MQFLLPKTKRFSHRSASGIKGIATVEFAACATLIAILSFYTISLFDWIDKQETLSDILESSFSTCSASSLEFIGGSQPAIQPNYVALNKISSSLATTIYDRIKNEISDAAQERSAIGIETLYVIARIDPVTGRVQGMDPHEGIVTVGEIPDKDHQSLKSALYRYIGNSDSGKSPLAIPLLGGIVKAGYLPYVVVFGAISLVSTAHTPAHYMTSLVSDAERLFALKISEFRGGTA